MAKSFFPAQKQTLTPTKLFRISDWWETALAPLLTLAYIEIIVLDIPPNRATFTLFGLFLSTIALSAYSHLINDIFDIKADTMVGKSNGMAQLTRSQQLSLVFLTLLLGVFPWLMLPRTPAILALLTAILLLQPLYAIPPIRLKGRGIWGTLSDVFNTHVFPMALVGLVFMELISKNNNTGRLLLLVAVTWAFLSGLRSILLHQIWDHGNDLRTDTHTWVRQIGVSRTQKLIYRGVFPLEVLIIIVGGVLLFPNTPGVILALGGYAILFWLSVALSIRTDCIDPAPSKPGSYILLFEFYTIWPAMLLLFALSIKNAKFFWLLLSHSLLFHGTLRKQAQDLFVLAYLVGRKFVKLFQWRVLNHTKDE